MIKHAEGDVASATSDIKDIPTLGRRRRECEGIRARVEVADEVIFPKAMDS